MELVGALSLAIDLGSGQPSGHALASAVLAARLAADEPADVRRDAMYLAALRFLGCTTDSHLAAAAFGDELAAAAFLVGSDYGSPVDVFGRLARHLAAGAPAWRRVRAVVRAMAGMPALMEMTAAHCEVGAILLDRMGFGPAMRAAYPHLFERWDGKGQPDGVKGEDLAPSARYAVAASDAVALFRAGGIDAVREAAGRRRGGGWAPSVADALTRLDAEVLSGVQKQPWDDALALEPAPDALSADELDRALVALGDFADAKSLSHAGHSRTVASLAAGAAARAGLDTAAVDAVRRAGWVHDLGRAGLPANLWNKPGPLDDAEKERVRLHTYHTERCLSRAPALAALGRLAAMHHERMDGSGYHRSAPASQQPLEARLLAAADVLSALREPRSWRPAYDADGARRVLDDEVLAGRLDRAAVGHVLDAAGLRASPARRLTLTDREVQVLKLLAVGRTTREIASLLGISPKTADHHVQHVYEKLGVSTRAGATCHAVELGLLDPFA